MEESEAAVPVADETTGESEVTNQLVEVEAAAFDEEGLLDLGDIDSFASASVADDFELEIDIEPVASLSEAAVLDNEPVVEAVEAQSSQPAEFKKSATEQTDSASVGTTEVHAVDAQPEVSNQLSVANLSPEAIEAISRRVVEQLSDKVVREIAWEVVPELSELMIKKRLEK